ncbi:MAG: hypothetical protein ACM3WV_10580 [Bacillota bacterium]
MKRIWTAVFVISLLLAGGGRSSAAVRISYGTTIYGNVEKGDIYLSMLDAEYLSRGIALGGNIGFGGDNYGVTDLSTFSVKSGIEFLKGIYLSGTYTYLEVDNPFTFGTGTPFCLRLKAFLPGIEFHFNLSSRFSFSGFYKSSVTVSHNILLIDRDAFELHTWGIKTDFDFTQGNGVYVRYLVYEPGCYDDFTQLKFVETGFAMLF